MPDVTRYVPVAMLAVGCALIFGIREQQRVAPRAPMTAVSIPAGAYKTTDVEVPEQERKVAGMSDYVLREFRRDSLDPGFSIYVGYYDYQVQGKTIHSPKNCLPGAGWEPMEASVRTMRAADGGSFVANRYLLGNKGQQALVYYWYQGRGRVEASEYRVKWNLLRDAAVHGRTEEALVRIVVGIDTRTAEGNADEVRRRVQAADSLAETVAARLEPEVRRVIPAAPGAA